MAKSVWCDMAASRFKAALASGFAISARKRLINPAQARSFAACSPSLRVSLLGDSVKPKFMQRGVEIPIVAVFFALVFWNFILGPVGVILAGPLTIAARRLYREFAVDVPEVFAR